MGIFSTFQKGDNYLTLENLVNQRRAYRALEPVEITKELIEKAARIAQLAPSCNNNQPWRFVFVYEKELLTQLQNESLNRGNAWAKAASLIIAVFSKDDMDCIIEDRKYFLFDTGMATSFMILYLTEQGLVAHPIAGFNPEIARKLLNIPDDMRLITLIIVGKKTDVIPDFFRDHQKRSEVERPKRKTMNEFIYMNRYSKE
jgi:nitroreductase